MKKYLIPLAVLVPFFAAAQETGRVLSSTPVIQQVAVQRQVCSQQQTMVQQPSSGAGALIGAIAGGLLGNTIGHGGGRAAATGVGIIAGAAVGDSVENRGAQAQVVQNCTPQTFLENRTVGYSVTYEYAGKQYTVQMPYDPGPTIQLQVTPVGAGQRPPASGQPLVTAPPMSQADTVQPVVTHTIVQPAPVHTVVYPSYAYDYGAYPSYGYGYGPAISLNLGYWHHRHSYPSRTPRHRFVQ